MNMKLMKMLMIIAIVCLFAKTTEHFGTKCFSCERQMGYLGRQTKCFSCERQMGRLGQQTKCFSCN